VYFAAVEEAVTEHCPVFSDER